MPPDQPEAAVRPLDAERARLRASGLTEDEISKIFVARELGRQPQQAAASAGPAGQSIMSGTLNNLSAVLSHVRGVIPAIARHIITVRDRSASASARLTAALSLTATAGLILVLGYAVLQEWKQHIVSATEIATAQVGKTRAEACTARAEAVLKAGSWSDMAKITKECSEPQTDTSDDYLYSTATDFTVALQRIKFKEVFTAKMKDYINDGHYNDAVQFAGLLFKKSETHNGEIKDFALKNVMYASLFVDKPDLSLSISEHLLELHPEDIEVQIGKAHALMFLGRDDEAKAIYRTHRYERLGLSSDKTWADVVRENFVQFKQAGKRPSGLAIMEAVLKGDDPPVRPSFLAPIVPTVPPPQSPPPVVTGASPPSPSAPAVAIQPVTPADPSPPTLVTAPPPPPVQSPNPQVAALVPLRPPPKPATGNPLLTSPQVQTLLQEGQRAVNAGNCNLAFEKYRAIDVLVSKGPLKDTEITAAQKKMKDNALVLYVDARLCAAR
jgi:hypothetical protein